MQLQELKETLILKRDDPNPPNSNKMQNNCARLMIGIIADYENGRISVREYKRQLKILHYQTMQYTEMRDLFRKAKTIFD